MSVSAGLDALKTAYEVEIARISNALRSAKATHRLERFVAASCALAGLEADPTQSYSMAGRTFTYQQIGALQDLVNSLQVDLDRYIYGGVHLVDHNRNLGAP